MDDCDNDDIATEQSAEGHEEPSPCSPFLSCGVCAGFIFTAHGFSFQPSPVELDKTITHSNTPFFENCLVKIWQPPKIDTALA